MSIPSEPQALTDGPPKEEKDTSLVGTTVGKYRVVRILGRGGMGAVYEAVHQALGQRIAIKVLRPDLSSDTRHVQRFFDEARAVNIVQHAGLIKVYDFGHLPDGTAYITMELLEGETLQERINHHQKAKQKMDLVEVLRISRQVSSALEAVHAKGIAHRDLKPANLFLVPDKEAPSGERAKILDFGIAKFYDSGKDDEGAAGGASHQLTTVGKLLGTPAYMSPEQCSGAEHIDGSIDVYGLGVILFQMLAGRLPFEAPHAVLLMTKHLTEPPPDLSEIDPSLPVPLCQLVHEMLAKERTQRPSMAQVVIRIEQLLESETGAASQQWRSQHRRRSRSRQRWHRLLAGVGIVLASLLLIQLGRYRRVQRTARQASTQPSAAMRFPPSAAIPQGPSAPASSPTTPPQLPPAAALPSAGLPALGGLAASPQPSRDPAHPTGDGKPASPPLGRKRRLGAKVSPKVDSQASAPVTAPASTPGSPTPPTAPVHVPIFR
ncbi:MAG: protein kinase [Myxococcales bacterium]|nr:protein kinase [Myxococcales bacterium]